MTVRELILLLSNEDPEREVAVHVSVGDHDYRALATDAGFGLTYPGAETKCVFVISGREV